MDVKGLKEALSEFPESAWAMYTWKGELKL